jgi:hydrogenase maturation protease
VLLIGFGNCGRGDDGLGPAFAERIESAGLPGVEIDIDYQLTVDHALAVAGADMVIFADALMDAGEPFDFAAIRPAASASLSSHSLTPAAVLALAGTLYQKHPDAFVLGIVGKDFGEVKEGLSGEARRNLGLAEAFFLDWYANFVVQAGATDRTSAA